MAVGGGVGKRMGVHHIWWFGSEASETLDAGWWVDRMGKGCSSLVGGWSEQPLL